MKKSIITSIKCIAISFATVGITSCSNTRFLKEGETLYTGSKLTIKGDSLSKSDRVALKDNLEENIIPKPNSSFFGLRPRLYIYNITSEPKKQKGLKYWLKYKVGQKPILLSDVDIDFNKKILVNYAENKGYFNAKAQGDTISKNKKAVVNYVLQPHKRYYINQVNFPKDTTLVVNKEINKTEAKTLLKEKQPFDLDVIKAERERIDSRLKENGFYYFHPDNIIVQADSTVTNKQDVELFVKLKDQTPEQAKKQFTIDKVIVFPDYNIRQARKGLYQMPMPTDSLGKYEQNGFYMVDSKKNFKPKVFDRALYFKTGDIYNRADHNLTLNRLVNLGVFKFVKNDFVISDSIDNKFDVYYTLTPREFQSLRLEVLGRTNSANYGGGELNLNWTHRNILKGAEQLKMALYGAFDMQLGGQKDANNIFRAGFNTQLSIP